MRNANLQSWDPNNDKQLLSGNPEDMQHLLLTFEDLCALYLVFKERKEEEILQVYFQMIKMCPDQQIRQRALQNA